MARLKSNYWFPIRGTKYWITNILFLSDFALISKSADLRYHPDLGMANPKANLWGNRGVSKPRLPRAAHFIFVVYMPPITHDEFVSAAIQVDFAATIDGEQVFSEWAQPPTDHTGCDLSPVLAGISVDYGSVVVPMGFAG